MAKNSGKMSASEAGRKGGKAPHNKRGQRGSDTNASSSSSNTNASGTDLVDKDLNDEY